MILSSSAAHPSAAHPSAAQPSAAELRALFVSASIGAGHHQAQMAVQDALRAKGVALQEMQSDVVAYLNAAERSWTVDLYALEVKYAPWLYEWFYHATDHQRPFSMIEFFCRWVGLSGMSSDVTRLRPEVVLSTYWSSVPLADKVRRRSGLDFLNALIVTDYRAHRHWVRPEAELLMVAAPETKEQMIKRGLSPDKVVVTGIPISPKFGALMGADKAALRQKHGLRPDLPLILLSGGGTGSYRAQNAVLTELGNLGERVQVLVLAGAQGRGVTQLGGATLHRLGFTTDFPELLAAADVVVGKAGGLTVAEATTLGVPMVIHEPIAGQEEYNADYLVRHGAALWAHSLGELRSLVRQSLDTDRHAELSRNAMSLGIPDAAERVAEAILHKLGRA